MIVELPYGMKRIVLAEDISILQLHLIWPKMRVKFDSQPFGFEPCTKNCTVKFHYSKSC